MPTNSKDTNLLSRTYFFMHFTSPQFYLCIFQVRDRFLQNVHSFIRILPMLQIYATREDKIYVPQICCYFNAVVT